MRERGKKKTNSRKGERERKREKGKERRLMKGK